VAGKIIGLLISSKTILNISAKPTLLFLTSLLSISSMPLMISANILIQLLRHTIKTIATEI